MKARGIILEMALLVVVSVVVMAPPPNRQVAEEIHKQEQAEMNEPYYQFPYQKYLELVVKILESEPKFQEKIRGMNEDEIKAGKIADHLDETISEQALSELTKAKISELDRIREDIRQQMEKDGHSENVKMPEHLDIDKWEKFGKDDLRKLIQTTVTDMEKIDEERRERFKKYEMEKKAYEDHQLAQMSPEERQKALEEIEAKRKRHNEHEKVNHPGGREQLEEVWEERDKMDKASFEPKAFFALHDLNGDGQWSEDELEALFQLELDKMYNETDPDDDPTERIEEMHRMREHVVKQIDKNGDRMISFDEFLQDSEAQNQNRKDEGWQDLQDLGQQKIYTDDELKKFEQEFAQQKAWGEHPYDPVTQPQVPQQFHQAPNVPVQPIQPVVHQQDAQPPPPNANIGQQGGAPVEQKPVAVDPVWGI